MAETKRISLTKWSGGIATNSKTGMAGSAKFMKNLDVWSDDDSVSLNPIASKVSGSTVVDMVKWGVDTTPFATDRYFYGDAGKIYKETSAGTWSVDRTVSGGAGQGLEVLADYLYYATSTTLGRKGYLSLTPSYNDDFLSDGSFNIDLNNSAVGHANTYTTPVAISESATTQLDFTPTLDPYKTIAVWVTAKGTGNWTLTVHDDSDTALASATVSNASLNNGAYNNFTFSTAWRPVIGYDLYHFHITSTVADGTVGVGTAANLNTADYKTYFGILLADTGFHPIKRFTNGPISTIAIGNGNYIAEWDQTGYDPNRIEIESGYKVRSLSIENEFLVAAAWKGDNIDSIEDGKLFYWDGTNRSYNYSKPVNSGSINAVTSYKNQTFSVLGSSGELALGTEPFSTVQRIPKLGRGKKIEVFPGALTVWQNRVQIGVAASTDDGTELEQGVYEYGVSIDDGSPNILNLGYTVSAGVTQATTFKIGCVWAAGKDLYIGWNNNGTYGVDKVIKTNNPASAGTWESLIFDEGLPTKEKYALKLVIQFDTLPSGATVTPKYKMERATSFTTGTAAVAGAVRAELLLNKRFKEIEFGFDLVATSSFPLIKSVDFEYMSLDKERGDY